jgi:hypothetical protein
MNGIAREKREKEKRRGKGNAPSRLRFLAVKALPQSREGITKILIAFPT